MLQNYPPPTINTDLIISNGNIKSYRSTELYIIDDVDPHAPTDIVMGRSRVVPHDEWCGLIRDFFQTYSDIKATGLCFRKRTTQKEVRSYWKKELATKTEHDLVIIYYESTAGGEDENHRW